MAVENTDIKYYKAGADALGGSPESAAIAATDMTALWDDITGVQSRDGHIDYRCAYVKNDHATLSLLNSILYIVSQESGGSTVEIGLDPAAASAAGASAVIADEETAPTGVTFSSPSSETDSLAIGDIAAGFYKAIWFKRTTASGTAAKDDDDVQVQVQGDSAE